MNQSPASSAPVPGFWKLTGAGEPFRFLFPLGVFLGIVGVMLWPLHVWGVLEWYPSIPHQRLMIEGFLTAFVIGFLGTAMPRLMEVPRMRLGEMLFFAALLLVSSGLHVARQTVAGDAVFFLLMLCFVARLIWRARQRRDMPPPSFVMVGLGMFSALAGAGLMVAGYWQPLPAWLYTLGTALLNQGYLLFPILGIGGFLLPRFMGLPTGGDEPESPTPTPEWKAEARVVMLLGLLIFGGFVVKALYGSGVMLAVMTVLYLARMLAGKPTAPGTLVKGFKLSLWTIPLGYLLIAALPKWQTAWLHVVVITGFNILTYVVATRVVFGHGGRSHLFTRRLWPVIVMMVCLWVATISRIGGEWLPPDARLLHYAYAAIFWIIGTLVWSLAVLPSVRRADDE